MENSTINQRPFPISRMRTSIMEDEVSSSRSQSQDIPPNNTINEEKMSDNTPLRRPSIFVRLWRKTGLNARVLIMMTKGALPQTIALAMYQNSSVADTYSTLGYVIAIMASLSLPILPRAQFIQTMLLNVIFTCISASVGLLQIYCSVKAREHTTTAPPETSNGPSPGTMVASYNSSASAVSAIWLFVQIYIISAMRAYSFHLLFPVIMFSIYTNIVSVYAPIIPTMEFGRAFSKSLLESFLTGYALATGVSLFVFPITVRMNFFKQSTGFIQLVQKTLGAQMTYLQSLERIDMFAPQSQVNREGPNVSEKAGGANPTTSTETQNLKATIAALGGLHTKMNADITFAKREIAWGKLDASEISEMLQLLQGIYLPLTGMSSAADIFERIAEKWAWTEEEASTLGPERSKKEIAQELRTQWLEIMETVHDPFAGMTDTMNAGLQHTLYTLELIKPPKKQKLNAQRKNGTSEDVEANAGVMKPGDMGFAKHLERRINASYNHRKSTLAKYCQEQGIELDPKSFRNSAEITADLHLKRTSRDMQAHQRNKRLLYLVLYMEFLLWSTSQAVLDLAKFADRKVEDGTLKRRRLILPGLSRMKEWLFAIFKDGNEGSNDVPDFTETGGVRMFSGQSYESAKDPDHLTPTNAWQHWGNRVREAYGFLGSRQSAYGFRVALATLSISIVAYLENTQAWFIEQRVVWATIMIVIGMALTAGDGVYGFIGRIGGTVLALVTSLIVWYIVDGHPAGVIVFCFIFLFIEFYFMIYPRFLVIALVTIVTQVLIIGYELEVRKVGKVISTSNGQPYYGIAKLSAYRIATVVAGMFACFIFTFFPYPLTARSQLRKELGKSLYLLANFYAICHTTFGLRVRAVEGDLGSRESAGRQLEKARTQVYMKEMGLLAEVKEHAAFTVWEPSFGGKFPRKQYAAITQEVNNILNYLALMSYASRTLIHSPSPSHSTTTTTTTPNRASWLHDFSRLVGSIDVTSHEITSILTLLSAAVTKGNSLPPYLAPPKPYELSRRLEQLDADILSITHIAEPGYSAFAVIQIASSLVSDDLGRLIGNVRALVGEVDFSFHVMGAGRSEEEVLDRAKTL